MTKLPVLSNTRQSRPTDTLSYRLIPTFKDYHMFTFYAYSIIHWNALPTNIPVLPTLKQFSIAVCQVTHPSLNTHFSFFFYLLTNVTLFVSIYKLISPTFQLVISANIGSRLTPPRGVKTSRKKGGWMDGWMDGRLRTSRI